MDHQPGHGPKGRGRASGRVDQRERPRLDGGGALGRVGRRRRLGLRAPPRGAGIARVHRAGARVPDAPAEDEEAVVVPLRRRHHLGAARFGRAALVTEAGGSPPGAPRAGPLRRARDQVEDLAGPLSHAGQLALPEARRTMHPDSSTATNAEAGIRFSWSSRWLVQRLSIVPWKYQFEPLSATIMP